MRKILYVTGSRADYGLMRQVLFAVDRDSQLDLAIAVLGMHLMPDYNSIEDIQRDNLKYHKLNAVQSADDRKSMGVFASQCLASLTELFVEVKPDIILLLGDRAEMIAGALAGTYLGIPVAHIHGGEVTSTVDESVRHAITKLAQIHFAATHDSLQRIKKLGERVDRIYLTGAPGLDMLDSNVLPLANLLSVLKLSGDRDLIVVLFHPVSEEIEDAKVQMEHILESVSELDGDKVIVYPNADAGRGSIIEVINAYASGSDFHVFGNLSRQVFVSLLANARLMIGNSSSGLIEAPTFKLPVVNVGSRQSGRLRGDNVIDSSFDLSDLQKSIQKALSFEFKERLKTSKNPYGDGQASERILEVLKNIELTSELIQKQITY